jgi:hypothetical protein
MKSLLKLAEILERLNLANEASQIISLAAKKKGIVWKKPHLGEEIEELERTANNLNLDIFDLKKSWDAGKLRKLKVEEWKDLENSDSWTTNSIEKATKLAKKYDRDIDSILLADRLPAPVILFRENGNPYLVSGNTRLMVCRALGYVPTIFSIEI